MVGFRAYNMWSLTFDISAHNQHELNSLAVSEHTSHVLAMDEEEEHYKLLPASKADHLCQFWQSCSDLHLIQTVCEMFKRSAAYIHRLMDCLILSRSARAWHK